jgi:hypothetical protein
MSLPGNLSNLARVRFSPSGTSPVGTTGIAATQVAFGSGTNQIRGSANFTYNSGPFTSSNTIETALNLSPDFSGQTGTAGWNALMINAASGGGNGTKNLIQVQTGGVTVFRVTSSGSVISSAAVTSISGSSGVGYATGAGGVITQATNRTTGVTLSKVCGQITTNNTSLATLASAVFTVTNTTVAITDTINICVQSGKVNAKTLVYVNAVGVGSFDITVFNLDTLTAETGAIVISFAVVKAVIA